jgi:hypothetical protein
MTVLVEPDTNLVRRITVDAEITTSDGKTQTTSYKIEYTEYGPISVEAPDWYDG